jgi:hypothetical protein
MHPPVAAPAPSSGLPKRLVARRRVTFAGGGHAAQDGLWLNLKVSPGEKTLGRAHATYSGCERIGESVRGGGLQEDQAYMACGLQYDNLFGY